jgi:pyruvate dehydrogenase E2 component (dihydrolipoamide acetyltransferase)
MAEQATATAAAPAAAAITPPNAASVNQKASELLSEIDASEIHTGASKALTAARGQLVTALMFVEMHFQQLETKVGDLFASAETAVKDGVAKVEASLAAPEAPAAAAAAPAPDAAPAAAAAPSTAPAADAAVSTAAPSIVPQQ